MGDDVNADLCDIGVWCGKSEEAHILEGDLGDLESHLAEHGIVAALTSPLAALEPQDQGRSNEWLAARCEASDRMVCVPVVNPADKAWIVGETKGVVRSTPAYHGYELDGPMGERLANYVQSGDLSLLIQMRMIDERNQRVGQQRAPVDLIELATFRNRYPELRLVACNLYMTEIEALAQQGITIGVDTALAEWSFTMDRITTSIDASDVYFSSHTPFLYTGASVAKLTRSTLPESTILEIASNGSNLGDVR